MINARKMYLHDIDPLENKEAVTEPLTFENATVQYAVQITNQASIQDVSNVRRDWQAAIDWYKSTLAI